MATEDNKASRTISVERAGWEFALCRPQQTPGIFIRSSRR
jgi:hypothetical protein